MNLDFLLTTDNDTKGGSSGENGSCSGLENTLRSGPSPLSLDFTAPRPSDFTNFNTHSHSNLSRRFADSGSPQRRSTSRHEEGRNYHNMYSSANSNSSKDQPSSSSIFKGNKCKIPSSVTPLQASSSGGSKPHVCANCERSFYKLEQLKRHNRLVHLNLRPFICHTCDLSFGTKQNMQVHLTTRKHQHRLQTLRGQRSSPYAPGQKQNQ